MANRLKDATSPYLQQHADNPVDWREWGPEALAEAQTRGLPLLISVGYSACHWCHVMAHESFEDADVAKLMNANFVNIKVDREERPDIDAVYMEATQAMTGHGGWPMTVFATPAGEPFYCGTYFPPTPHRGMPSFTQVLQSVASAWAERREDVERSGAEIVRQLAERASFPTGEELPTAEQRDAAVSALVEDFDARYGGFGGAPKFPPSTALEFLLRYGRRTGDVRALQLAGVTLEAMARGGIYDQLAGGFARYSVDGQWVVPHFEKMLYDNALLLRVYLHWWALSGVDIGRRVATETAEFLIRELELPEGGFASALDADSEGVEGKFYAWTPQQLAAALGADGPYAAEMLSVTDAGTFEHGASVLQLSDDPADEDRWRHIRSRLLAARESRVRPGRDDKLVAAWNGLAVAALSEAAVLLERDDFLVAARRAATVLTDVHLVGSRLRRTSRDGLAGTSDGVLEDYADVAEGLIALAGATGEPRWFEAAGTLLDVAVDHFAAEDGGFFDTAADAEQLVRRPRDPLDGPTPSGSSALAGALVSYAALTGSTRHRTLAEHALAPIGAVGARYPRAAGWGLAVAEALAAGPLEVAVIGPADDQMTRRLHRAALAAAGSAVVVASEPSDAIALLVGRGPVDGQPAAYVCRGNVCDRPVTTVEELAELLRPR